MNAVVADSHAAPIPLVVLGGYLGAGKTTLLNYVLSHLDQQRVAVLVNDFGDINIDAALIRERTDDVINLENGCICCSIGGRLVDTLLKIGARPERPELLIIEASGVSDPQKIAQIGMLDRDFRLSSIVVVVDAERIGATLDDPYVGDIVRRQVAVATALVLTKTDLVSEREKAAVSDMLSTLSQGTLQIEAVSGAIPMGLILDAHVAPRHRTQQLLAQSVSSRAHHRDICSFSFRSRERFQRDRLKDVFRHRSSAVVLRAKGVVWLSGAATAHELHVVGSRIMLTPFGGAEPNESKIVLIGRFSDEDEQRLMLELENAQG